jgi:hypothetical protein
VIEPEQPTTRQIEPKALEEKYFGCTGPVHALVRWLSWPKPKGMQCSARPARKREDRSPARFGSFWSDLEVFGRPSLNALQAIAYSRSTNPERKRLEADLE